MIHIIAHRITDHTWRLAALADGEEFSEALARADEVARLIAMYRRVMQGERLEDILPKSRDFH